jgi:hypothetical protein
MSFRAEVETAYVSGKGSLPSDLIPAMLRVNLGITLEEVMNSPAWYIDDILLILENQNKGHKK